MKKILVTGGCGFIGSEVVDQLLNKGYRVRVVDNLSKPESSVKKGYEFLNLDLTNEEQAERAFAEMDYCINLAAKIGGIGYFHKYPATILSENNKIYSATSEAAVRSGIKRMVYVSSSMVFESTDRFPSKEVDITQIPPPISAYGFSKLSGEWYCRAFYEEYGLKYSICRPFNAYGINEFPGEEVGYAHVVPDLIKKILAGQYPLKLLGDGQQIRCFTHVKDLADGIITVLEAEQAENEDFNVGTDGETKMIDLAKMIWQLSGQKKKFEVEFVPGFKHDIKRRVPDVSKMKKLLGWEAKISLEEGLPEIIEWLQKELE